MDKSICFKCLHAWAVAASFGTDDTFERQFNRRWSEGRLFCPILFRHSIHAPALDTESDPPAVCPYKFEHAVAAGESSEC